MIRLLPALAVLLLAIAATWFLARRSADPAPPTPAPAAAALATVTSPPVTPAVAATTPSPGHRLAGTVVGDVQFAVIEAPDGSNELYGIDDQVPGLGKLVAIGARSATFEGNDGRFDMPLIAAPTPTARPERKARQEVADDEQADDEFLYEEGLEDEGYDEEVDDYAEEDQEGDDAPPEDGGGGFTP